MATDTGSGRGPEWQPSLTVSDSRPPLHRSSSPIASSRSFDPGSGHLAGRLVERRSGHGSARCRGSPEVWSSTKTETAWLVFRLARARAEGRESGGRARVLGRYGASRIGDEQVQQAAGLRSAFTAARVSGASRDRSACPITFLTVSLLRRNCGGPPSNLSVAGGAPAVRAVRVLGWLRARRGGAVAAVRRLVALRRCCRVR